MYVSHASLSPSSPNREGTQRRDQVARNGLGKKRESVEKGLARRKDVPKLRKYERRVRVTTRQVVEKLDRVDKAFVELRKRESAASSRASGPVEVGYLGQAVEKIGLQWRILVSRHIGEGCGQGTEAPVLTSDWLQQGTASSTAPVSWEMELKMRAIGRSASRGLGPARQTETTPVAVVMA